MFHFVRRMIGRPSFGHRSVWGGIGVLLLLVFFVIWNSSAVSVDASGPIPTSGLVLLLEADRNVASSDSVVTGWLDQSGHGNNLSATGGPQLIPETTPSGRPAIAFHGGQDGEGDRLERVASLNNLPDGDEDRTLFLVVNYSSSGYGGFAYGKDRCGQAFGLIVDKGGKLSVQRWCDDHQTPVRGTGEGWLVQSAVLREGRLAHYKDGALIADEAETAFNTVLNRLVIGAEIDAKPHLDMDVAAVLIYDRALSDAERERVEQYLQDKYLAGASLDERPIAGDDGAASSGP